MENQEEQIEEYTQEELFLPFELDYRLPEVKQKDPYYNMELDLDKVNYNQYYKSPEFFYSKFSGDPSNLPGFDKIIGEMVKNAKYPIEGWIIRQNKNVDDIYIDEQYNTNIFELQDSLKIQ